MTAVSGRSIAAGTVMVTLIVLSLVAVFFPAFAWMHVRFTEPDSSYSHGYLLPAVAGILVWRKRKALAALPVSSSPFGLALVVAGLVAHVAGGVMLRIGFVSGYSLIMVLLGLSLYLYGPAITRAALFPLLFLLLMIPLPKVFLIGITFKIKMIAAQAATSLLTAMQLDVQRAGSFIHLPNGVLMVGDECSGINSLISLFTLSVLFAFMVDGSPVRRALFVLFSMPVALVSNIGRIMFLTLAAYVYGVDAAMQGVLHYGAGVTLWIVALAMLSLLWRLFQWQHRSTNAGT